LLLYFFSVFELPRDRGPGKALTTFIERGSHVIGRITPAGVITEYSATPGGDPRDITAGPDGALWFTQDGACHCVPEGITAGPDGALWFTEFNVNQIGRITTARGCY
jgi:virginiamycin B lyase